MVCFRCKMVVKAELNKIGIYYTSVKLGEADIDEPLTEEQLFNLNIALKKTGLELMKDKKLIQVEKIKTQIIELVNSQNVRSKIKLSDFIASKLNHNYTYLSSIFLEWEGTTIEQFYLTYKIEKVKEMLIYDDLSLTEIAYRLHYSSVAHLSNQFKKMTGITPSRFKELKQKKTN